MGGYLIRPIELGADIVGECDPFHVGDSLLICVGVSAQCNQVDWGPRNHDCGCRDRLRRVHFMIASS